MHMVLRLSISLLVICGIIVSWCAQQPSTPSLTAIPDDQTTPAQPLMAQVLPDQDASGIQAIDLAFNKTSRDTNRSLSIFNGVLVTANTKECNIAPEWLYCNGNKEFDAANPQYVKYRELFGSGVFRIVQARVMITQPDWALIFTENRASFDVLTNTSYVNSGNQIWFPLTWWQIALLFKEYHMVQGIAEVNPQTILQLAPLQIYPQYHTLVYNSNPQWWSQQIALCGSAPSSSSQEQGFWDSLFQWSSSSASQPAVPCAGSGTVTLSDPIVSKSRMIIQGYSRTTPASLTLTLQSWASTPVSITPVMSWSDAIVQLPDLIPNTPYSLTLRTSDGVEYTLNFQTFAPFALISQKNITGHILSQTGTQTWYQWINIVWSTIVSQYNNNYHLCFNQPLDEESVLSSLTKAMGSGAYSASFSFNTQQYNPDIGRNYCVMLYYYVDPTKTHTYTLEGIQSIAGSTLPQSAIMTIVPHQITDQHAFVTSAGNAINILPRLGAMSTSLQLNYKNIPKTDLRYRSCTFRTGADLAKSATNVRQPGEEWVTYELARNFIQCGPSSKRTVSFKNFERRKSKVEMIDTSTLFPQATPQFFQIWFAPFQEDSVGKIFIRTNIGIHAKYSLDTVHLWLHRFDTGKAITSGTVTVGYLVGRSFQSTTKSLDSTNYLSFAIPKDATVWYAYVQTPDDQTFMILSDPYFWYQPTPGGNTFISYNNNFGIEPRQIGGQRVRDQPGRFRMYGYSDRVLYKLGDTIEVSGRLRQPGVSKIPQWPITVTLRDPDYTSIATRTITSVDEFGGFVTQFPINSWSKLWTYTIGFVYAYPDGSTSEYTHYLQIQEYKKSSYRIDTSVITGAGETWSYLRVRPSYYFGPDLKSFDAQLDYTLRGDGYGLRDREHCGKTRCDEPFYYNRIWWDGFSSGWFQTIKGYTNKFLDIPLKVQTPVIANFSLDIVMVDQLTQEVVTKSVSQSIYPSHLIGFKGYEYVRHTFGQPYSLVGKVMQFAGDRGVWLENYQDASAWQALTIDLYYADFAAGQEQWPDGERYYADTNYKKIKTLTTTSRDDGAFSLQLPLDQVGKYFVRTRLGDQIENQRTINVYDTQGASYYNYRFYGQIQNNFTLTVDVADREYQEGELATINIEPYIKGATALVTVEKEGKILSQSQTILDGAALQVKVQKSRFPNAHVSVVQFVGEQTNANISKQRKEPRIFMGYTNLKLDPSMMHIDRDVSIQDASGKILQYAQPGQKVRVSVVTKDANGKPIKTRISAGVIDQALIDIYDQLRQPLEAIYFFTQPGFSIVSNRKNLYLALKVFSADGLKGWGWWGAWASPINLIEPRKNFLDVAYRNAALLTNNQGQISFEMTMPDNVTTRIVDLIAVGSAWQMDTHRSSFKTTKPVIVQPNLPKFVTRGDAIAVPVGVVTQDNFTGIVQFTGTLSIWSQREPISIYQANGKKYFDLLVNRFDLDTILSYDDMIVDLQAGMADRVRVSLPIRKDGLIQRAYHSYAGRDDTHTIDLEQPARSYKLTATVSTVPIKIVENWLKYLIRYPYGCTEQTLSSLYPLLIASQLWERGYLSRQIYNSGMFMLNGTTREDPVPHVNAAIQRLSIHQKAGWLMWYRPGNTYYQDVGDIQLSIYTYLVLSALQDQWQYIIKDTFIDSLERSLNQSQWMDAASIMMFQFAKAVNGKSVSAQYVQELLKKYPNDMIIQTYGYATLAYLWTRNAATQDTLIKYFTNNNTNAYGVYSSPNILRAVFLRWLVKNQQLTQAYDQVIHFHKTVDQQWLRWRSTQENMQIIIALGEFISAVKVKDQQSTYSLNILDRSYTGVINQWSLTTTYVMTGSTASSIDTKFVSSASLLLDIAVEYIPQDIDTLPNKLVQMSALWLSSSATWQTSVIDTVNDARIGDVVTLHGSFAIQKDVRQFAVVYAIPSNITIINPDLPSQQLNNQWWNQWWNPYQGIITSNRQGDYRWWRSSSLRFTSIGNSSSRYSCYPSHYEVRFDKLFLYYDALSAGAGCRISFDTIKTHYGKVNVLPTQAFQMYGADIRGRAMIK